MLIIIKSFYIILPLAQFKYSSPSIASCLIRKTFNGPWWQVLRLGLADDFGGMVCANSPCGPCGLSGQLHPWRILFDSAKALDCVPIPPQKRHLPWSWPGSCPNMWTDHGWQEASHFLYLSVLHYIRTLGTSSFPTFSNIIQHFPTCSKCHGLRQMATVIRDGAAQGPGCRSALQETPRPTGQEAPCLAGRPCPTHGLPYKKFTYEPMWTFETSAWLQFGSVRSICEIHIHTIHSITWNIL